MIKMKLVVYNRQRLGGLLKNGSIVDLNLAYMSLLAQRGVARPHAHAYVELPARLLSFIEEGESALKAAEEAIAFAEEGNKKGLRGEKLVYKPEEVKIRAPLPSLASRIAMAGANFYDHAAGAAAMIGGKEVTAEDIMRDVDEGRRPPWGFWKHARNVIGHEDPIVYPARTGRLDYEVEVAAILGKKGKDIAEDEATDYIFGYTILNDISARDQPNDRGLFYGKNFDTSAPLGPCIVTADELGDPHTLALRLKVNDVTKQDGSMKDMIRNFPFWISHLTRDMTFYPGDIISGGTCEGTALDTSPRDAEGRTEPDNFINPGDVLEAWVEKIGTLRNTVVAKQ
jgi:acylpyruvate hydrolase